MADFLRCKNGNGSVVYINMDRIDCFQSCITPDGQAGYMVESLGNIFYSSIHNEKLFDYISKAREIKNEESDKNNNNKPVLQRDSSPMDCEDPFQDD